MKEKNSEAIHRTSKKRNHRHLSPVFSLQFKDRFEQSGSVIPVQKLKKRDHLWRRPPFFLQYEFVSGKSDVSIHFNIWFLLNIFKTARCAAENNF